MAGSNGVNGVAHEQRAVSEAEVLVLDAQKTLLEQRISYKRQSVSGVGLKRSGSISESGKSAKRPRHAATPVDPKEALFTRCRSMLTTLKKNSNSGPFLVPVDPVLQQCLDYFDVVKKPMDLRTVTFKLKQGARVYNTPLEFRDDMMQIFVNCQLYNPPSHPLYEFAEKMKLEFEKKWKRSMIEQQWLELTRLEGSGAAPLPGGNLQANPDDETGQHLNMSSAMAQGGSGHVSHGTPNQHSGPSSLPFASMTKLERELTELTELTEVGGTVHPSNVDETAPMPFVQRRQLSRRLDALPEHKLKEIGGILAESEVACEEEMHLDALDNRTLWSLQQLVDSVLPDGTSHGLPENGVS